MKKEKFYETIEQLTDQCLKDDKDLDIVYLCSDKTYDEDLGFEFSVNPLVDFEYCCKCINNINIHIIKSSGVEYKNEDKFIISPKESKPIRVRFE